jgi:RNA polymerase sigma-70 factor (ECF subfamily)
MTRFSPTAAQATTPTPALTFESVYQEHFSFVWRNVVRLGTPPGSVDDAVQDVFVVVHRNLATFEGRSSIRTWLFAVTLRVVRDHRHKGRRRLTEAPLETTVVADQNPDPQESAAHRQALRVLDRGLEQMSEENRAVAIMILVEQMSGPEVADALGINLNTVYSRLRVARQELARHFAGEKDDSG